MEKIKLYRERFSGLPNVYGTYDPKAGRVRQVKAPVTDRVLHDHLCGKAPYGVYLLRGALTSAVAADFDVDDPLLALQFVRVLTAFGLGGYVERSKSKGYHVWMFFPRKGVSARKARLVVRGALKEILEEETEVFPKQDRLTDQSRYGNFINAPLFGDHVPRGRTVFLDASRGFEPYEDQWRFLAGVRIHTEADLDSVIENNGLFEEPAARESNPQTGSIAARFEGLAPCSRRMLSEGVTERQRDSCFRLAVQLKRMGLSEDYAIQILSYWKHRNHPKNGKGVIRDHEIRSQVSGAYSGPYRSFGCEKEEVRPFCDPDCPIRQSAR